jgi:hypothetical protein
MADFLFIDRRTDDGNSCGIEKGIEHDDLSVVEKPRGVKGERGA